MKKSELRKIIKEELKKINEVSVSDLVIGKKYKVNSNLDGTFTVKYNGVKNGKHSFDNVTNKDFKKKGAYSFTDNEISKKVKPLNEVDFRTNTPTEKPKEDRPDRGPYKVTSRYVTPPDDMVKGSKQHIFQPQTGDEIEFDVEDVKDTSGEIAGYSPDGTLLYIKTKSGKYIVIKLATEAALIKKIILASKTIILPPLTL